jgi:hypothetical protein
MEACSAVSTLAEPRARGYEIGAHSGPSAVRAHQRQGASAACDMGTQSIPPEVNRNTLRTDSELKLYITGSS